MKCPNCNYENDKGTKFCTECGTPLFKKCDKCGATVQLYAKFCAECGTQFPILDLKIERYKRILHFYDHIQINGEKGEKYIVAKENGKYILLNIKTLNPMSERSYDDLGKQHWSFIFAKYNGKWGVVNPTNDSIICDFKYENYKDDDCNGTARFLYNGKWGRIDCRTGAVYLPFIYDEIEYDSRVKYKGLWGAKDNKGKEIVPCEYLELSPYRPCENIWPSQYQNGKWGVINILNGNIIIEFDYDEIEYHEPFGISVYYLRKGDKWGKYSQDGKRIPCIHNNKEVLHHL